MALVINTNSAALAAYQNLSAQSARQDAALAGASIGAAPADRGTDTVSLSTANAAAAASAAIPDTDIAAQLTQLAAAQISSNAAGAMAAQANLVPQHVLSLLQ